MGVLGGAVEQNRGPHLTSALLIPPSERLRCTDFDPGPLARPPSHFLPSAASSPSAPGGFSYRSGGPTLVTVA